MDARVGLEPTPIARPYPIDCAVLTEYSERVAGLRVVHLPATARDQSTALGPLRLLVQARLQVGLRFSSDPRQVASKRTEFVGTAKPANHLGPGWSRKAAGNG